jgi:hypothetical protein
MIDIRIVCTHDAVKTAETLRRLLEAEMHAVEINFGRHSLDHFDDAEAGRDIVLLIWSNNAPGAYYMIDWAMRFDSARLIEIAIAPGWPDLQRSAPVIDFSQWHGERGGGAWRALTERLRTLGRASPLAQAPPPPAPKQAAMALGLLSAAAVAGALFVRANEAAPALPAPAAPEQDAAVHVTASEGLGGPLERTPFEAVEPPSAEDATFIVKPRLLTLAPLRALPDAELASIPSVPQFYISPPTLLERLESLNPFRREDQ